MRYFSGYERKKSKYEQNQSNLFFYEGNTDCIVMYLPNPFAMSRMWYNEQDMQDTAGEARTSS